MISPHLMIHQSNYSAASYYNLQLGIERVLACIRYNISRSRYVAIETQPVHLLQIRPIVHN